MRKRWWGTAKEIRRGMFEDVRMKAVFSVSCPRMPVAAEFDAISRKYTLVSTAQLLRLPRKLGASAPPYREIARTVVGRHDQRTQENAVGTDARFLCRHVLVQSRQRLTSNSPSNVR